jgi:hypothetical protein
MLRQGFAVKRKVSPESFRNFPILGLTTFGGIGYSQPLTDQRCATGGHGGRVVSPERTGTWSLHDAGTEAILTRSTTFFQGDMCTIHTPRSTTYRCHLRERVAAGTGSDATVWQTRYRYLPASERQLPNAGRMPGYGSRPSQCLDRRVFFYTAAQYGGHAARLPARGCAR